MLQFIKNIDWETIFASWKRNEAGDAEWQKVATQIKGWKSWEAWRRHMADQFRAPQREW